MLYQFYLMFIIYLSNLMIINMIEIYFYSFVYIKITPIESLIMLFIIIIYHITYSSTIINPSISIAHIALLILLSYALVKMYSIVLKIMPLNY